MPNCFLHCPIRSRDCIFIFNLYIIFLHKFKVFPLNCIINPFHSIKILKCFERFCRVLPFSLFNQFCRVWGSEREIKWVKWWIMILAMKKCHSPTMDYWKSSRREFSDQIVELWNPWNTTMTHKLQIVEGENKKENHISG